MTILNFSECNLANQRVLIREDLNVPLLDGKVTNDTRIKATLPTIQAAISQRACTIIMSHLGRPTEGEFDSKYSLAPVAKRLGELLEQDVIFVKDWLDGISVEPGQVVLCENVRFNQGEKENSPQLAKRMASLCDIFVMDAFATAHRAQASTYGVAEFAPLACAGPLLISELEALDKAKQNPAHPVTAIVGGAKVSTKLTLLESMVKQVDQMIVGGGIANTFMAAAGLPIGQSLSEPDLIPVAKSLLDQVDIPIPVDVVVATSFSADAPATLKNATEVGSEDMILDIGPKTAELLADKLMQAGTIIWNGPVGVFEWPQFANGTQQIAQAIAKSPAYSLAGGGDTIAAIDTFDVGKDISYISTGGGAFLEFLEGKTLPAVAILKQRAQVNI